MFSDSVYPDISIILPVYNRQDTVSYAIRSVAEQTLPPGVTAELIIIDDCSSDNSLQQARESSKVLNGTSIHPVFLTHPCRYGSSAAQRTGMAAARGRWLARIDSDDTYPSGYLSALYRTATATGAHIACAPIRYHDRNGRTLRFVNVPRRLTGPNGCDLNQQHIDTVTFSLCNKLIDRHWLADHHIHGPIEQIDCWDDLSMLARVYAYDVRVHTDRSIPSYNYMSDPTIPSLTRKNSNRVLRDRLRCVSELERMFRLRNIDTRFAPFLTRLKIMAKTKYLCGPDIQIKTWQTTFPEVNKAILSTQGIPLAYRLLMTAVAILPSALTQTIADHTFRH